eukprot:TRINITY_DN9909_c0_g1_i1.p1 TRINITY_DN9909_c0_g1~~TRINITY_DN9909_c0_g1_i1.p1  ORF type:complete len:321 (-),score=78.47 TRINITY_DN9909_c0_g1_i1:143-1054(-)
MTETHNSSPIKGGRISVPELCPHCPKMLSRRDKLINHIKTQHPGSPIPLASSTRVSEPAPGKENVLKHLPLPCPFCDKILSRRDKLNNHLKSAHSMTKYEKKQEEEIIFSDNENIASADHLDDKPKVEAPSPSINSPKKTPQPPPSPNSPKKKRQPPPCPYCKAVLSRMDKLTKHIEKKHPGKKFTPPKLKKPSECAKKVKSVVKKEVKSLVKRDPKKVNPTPWDLLWNSKEPVFVKFAFKKKSFKRQRTESESTIDFELETKKSYVTPPRSSPQITKLVKPPKPGKSSPSSKIQILEAFKYK